MDDVLCELITVEVEVIRCQTCGMDKLRSEYDHQWSLEHCKSCTRVERNEAARERSRTAPKYGRGFHPNSRASLHNPGSNFAKRRRYSASKYRDFAEAKRLSRYGMSRAAFDELLAKQGGVCLGCLAPLDFATACIDHDHACCSGSRKTCGQCVRGLLCHMCNVSLGMARDSADNLRRLADYLTDPVAKRA